MKYWFALILLLGMPLWFWPSQAQASCACETGSGKIVALPDSEGMDDDSECEQACVAENYHSGQVYDEDSSAAIASQQAQSIAEQFADSGNCTCYCGQKGSGAGAVSGTFADALECKAECDTLGKSYVSCGTSAEDSPMGNLLCYASDECDSSNGVWGSDQPAECEAGQHYCYPEPEPIELSVHLGEITQVYNIGSFINAFYNYALGAAAIIAIVMIMIGGVQWMIGSSVGHADAARKRINNAVVGLVLLLAAYIILKTVNPYLVQFKSIELPMMKASTFVNGSCEDYAAAGYEVAPQESGQTFCGDEGVILSNASGVAATSTCVYEKCSNSAAGCSKLSGDYQCMTCQSYNSEAADAGVYASESICASLQPSINVKGQTILRCEYIKDADFNNAIIDLLGSAPWAYIPVVGTIKIANQAYSSVMETVNSGATGLCGMVKIDCSSIDTCRDYDSVDIYSGDPEQDKADLDDIEGLLQEICVENPCRVSDGPCSVGELDVDSLTYTLGIEYLDCYSKSKEEAQSKYIDSSASYWGAKTR